ncbi:MAG: metalloregulator ArsR/SmtB family transcription factor [Pseudomonadota bacterium]
MEVDQTDQIWKALSDPTRRTILDLLHRQPRLTGELADAFDLSRFAVMKHLNVLENAGLVVVRREGRKRWNHLNAAPLRAIYERWVRAYQDRWATTLFQLKQFAELEEGTDMTEANASKFREVHIEQAHDIAAPVEIVFDALVNKVSQWWRPPFVHRPETKQLTLEPHLGGRLYEDWGDGDGMVLGFVTTLKRPEELRVTGSIGMRGPVSGEVRFELAEEHGGTRINLSHQALGVTDEENEANYRGGWEELIGVNLRALIEPKP